ncbi:MAG: hypothetical protein ACXADY_18695 [Candidatus Hodarchaeales archaeon]|jgi:hypothetical protein
MKDTKIIKMVVLIVIISFSFTFLVFNTTITGQKIKYQKTFGGINRDGALSIIETSNGGFALAGFTRSYGAGNNDAWLVKTDAYGLMLWNKTYGGLLDEKARCVIQTKDEGYLLAGSTDSYGLGGEDVWLVKTDAHGLVLWNKTYGGTQLDFVESLIQTTDGGFALAGFTINWLDLAGLGNGGGDMWIVKIDSSGNIQWNQTYKGEKDERMYAIIQTDDGGFALAGKTTVSRDINSEIWLVKTNSIGEIQWNQTFKGAREECVYSLIQTSDEGFILAGINQTLFSMESDIVIVKTDVYGTMMWSQTYSGECTYNVLQTADGGFAFAGYTTSYGHSDVIITKIDANGGVEWQQIIIKREPEIAYSLLQTSDGGFVIAGISEAFDMGKGDMWLVKTNPTSGLEELIDSVQKLNYWGIFFLCVILIALIIVIKKQKRK